ncbi:amylo-alpha-1,6-glucosidase [Pseudomonas japonica]|uniref:amylo-alpha-1,6-glucosidase n=1 Tax=Pseudomonas japonica TaxID=256466 RepID=UPI0015E41E8D|nr:amylo-alpha-1,6-glucosidase [Pseudomonas japonica]MBA1287271.1 amylo-alpha-1,6-glucosidase [Pseudomonas japonica]
MPTRLTYGEAALHPSELGTAVPEGIFVLLSDDTLHVADAYGDVYGGEDGLFRDDTRILSRYRLTLAGQRPSLLSAKVSQDNVYFISHLTNHALPALGEDKLPQGVLHIERKRLIWDQRLFECVSLVNYSDRSSVVPLRLEFAADFRDMFEVRGAHRASRGTQAAPVVGARQVKFGYVGLDRKKRDVAISFSTSPTRLDERSALFAIKVAARAQESLYIEIGAAPEIPSRLRFRAAAARARSAMKAKQRRGATFKVSGRLFQGWLDKSRADLALLTSDLPTGPYPYAGTPWFSTPFGRDAVITAYQLLWINPAMAKGVLGYLGLHQAREVSTFRDAEPGKIMHETRKGEMSSLNELPFGRYYGGVDTTPLFVMLAGAYARRTLDHAFIETLWPALELAAQWIESNAVNNRDGFVSYARGETSGLANQGWKDSHDSVSLANGGSPEGPIALVEVQGYAYGAYLSMAQLCEMRGQPERAQHWAARAEAMREAVERCFWMEEQQFYALALDGRGKQCQVCGSNPGHLLFTGLPRPERGRLVARKLLSPPLHSGWGVRTLGMEEARYNPMSYHNGSVWPHDVALCAAGIARYGGQAGAEQLLSGIFEAAVHFDMRLPELFCGFARTAPCEAPTPYPVACLPQAWAAGSAFMLLQACLGIQIDARQARVIVTDPQLPAGIDWLKMRHLQFGDYSVDITFQRVGDRVSAYIEHQSGPTRVLMDIRI